MRFALLLLTALALNGCVRRGGPAASDGAETLRIAYFPNVTHAVALVGTARGTFAGRLGRGLKIEEQIFNAGPAQIEALFGDQVDIGYIGPGPALNGFLKSRGRALKIIAGASSGGAALVARADSGISDLAGLAGKRVASPQLGGTQDLSLRHALAQAGFKTTDKGGSVMVLPTANPDTLTLFLRKELDAAWVPEPWVARLVREGGGRILIDERSRWPDSKFATTVVIARTKFLDQNPDLVARFLDAHVETVEWIRRNRDEARRTIGRRIEELTGKGMPEDVLKDALSRTDITYDPLRGTVLEFAAWSRDLGFQRDRSQSLDRLFDLAVLNSALDRRKLPAVR